MILDTGPTDIVLSRSIVNRLGLVISSKQSSGTDAAGRNVFITKLTAPDIAINGWGKLTHTTVELTPLPQAFDALGIAGVLSPQRLARPGDSVVVDFSSRKVFVVPNAKAPAYLGHLPRLGTSPTVCKKKAGRWLYGATFRVNGITVPLMFDTGASTTSVQMGAIAGKATGARKHLEFGDALCGIW